ncbi:MATE family efflux transporter [Mucilaginibacter ginsenosidivorans]|uniref:Multidrug-efflux transporter n=1 Tax=Mucilaginibacter ginsenosidivorans TaxID=398053 RepID=A0A5B8V2J4_9SPHI|nr:MATE family efflux transporter [Mucilaginibacter ginsenosidivorans]QEC64901.1 MATE family efflux transporter [Mucilaginibacter ginsenosidivorans]
MTTFQPASNKLSRTFSLLKQALKGGNHDFTQGSIRRAVLLLAIPMMLEMVMESVFAIVDLFFVGHLKNSSYAVQTVGLTESVLTIIYSLAIGLSMAATAVVARRMGEHNPVDAAKAGMQTISIALIINILIGGAGFYFAADILRVMGATAETIRMGVNYTRIMMGETIIIVLLFLINGIFRGAGNAAIAMRSLWIANIANIILCPLFVNGLGLFPGFGVTGAAIATTIGRGTGVCYQVYHLFNGRNMIKARMAYLRPHWEQAKAILKIALPGIFQFTIGSCSWIFLSRLVANVGGDEGSAGYQTAIRLLLFFMLPAWGMSNAAATLVGQNLGAKQPDRAEDSVYKTIKYNMIYMGFVTLISLAASSLLAAIFSNDVAVRQIASKALLIMSTGYIFYGIGMVMMSAFNGAGDTWATTKLNFIGFWLFQVPLAYVLAKTFNWGTTGVFIAIPISQTFIAVTSYLLFKRGNWKKVKV